MKQTDAVLSEQNETHQFEELIQGLMDRDFGCCDDFFPMDVVAGLRANLEDLRTGNHLKSAGVGAQADFRLDNNFRGDTIHWIADDSQKPFERIYLDKMQRFVDYLNHTCYTNIRSFESHYARYEKNSFYKRHLDQFKNEKGRKFSMVLYLNDDWQAEDGGMLTLYFNDRPDCEIAPLGGRLVFFRSDQIEHEVKASTTRDRLSIACWLKDK